jgi:myo-inositol-1(or 4)-monophosphatase
MSDVLTGSADSSAVVCRVAAALAAVRARTGYMLEHFGKAESLWKYDGTRVTAVDLAISKGVFEDLRREFPEDLYFSEETEPGGAPVPLVSRFVWIIDPVDGTNNYALGVPVCAISLALLDDGVPVCGFVYDLGTRTLLHGGPGIGLFADGVAIARHPSPTGDMRIVAIHSPIDARHMPIVNLVLENYKLRGHGSGALHLTYVALGRVDACLDFTVRVWDIAAAWAFCQVTGVETHFFSEPVFPMRVFDLHMKPIRYIAAPADAMAELLPRIKALGYVD